MPPKKRLHMSVWASTITCLLRKAPPRHVLLTIMNDLGLFMQHYPDFLN